MAGEGDIGRGGQLEQGRRDMGGRSVFGGMPAV